MIPSHATQAQIDEYSSGSCHILAVALHRHLGWEIDVRLDNGEPYWTDEADPDNFIPAVLHVYAIDPHDQAWDIRGVRPCNEIGEEMESMYFPSGPDSDQLRNELQLRPYVGCWAEAFDDEQAQEIDRPLCDYTDEDVALAWGVACRVFKAVAGFDPHPAPVGQASARRWR